MIDNNINFSFKTTNELELIEIEELNRSFNSIFRNSSLNKRSLKEFHNKFSNNFLGYSFHGIMKKENNIIGSYSVIPREFNFFSEKKIFGLAVDTGIDPNHRGNLMNLHKLALGVYDLLKKNNINFVYGHTNNNIYLVRKKLMQWKDISNFNFYVHPVNLKNHLGFFSFLNIFILLLVKIVFLLKPTSNKIISLFNIYKINNENFIKSRYDTSHIFESDRNSKFVYKIIEKDIGKNKKIKTAYIIDTNTNDAESINDIIKKISSKEKDISLIIYVTSLNLRFKNMFKIPSFLMKENTLISGKRLSDKDLSNELYESFNWSLNFSDFDLY